MKKLQNKEAKLQSEIVRWFNNTYCLKHHTPQMMIESSPNELLSSVWGHLPSKVRYIISGVLKATGMNKGTSDLKIYIPGKILLVELKTETGTQSKDQKEYERKANDLGLEYFIIRSLPEFQKLIESKLSLHESEQPTNPTPTNSKDSNRAIFGVSGCS